MRRVFRRYTLSVLLAACIAGLMYSWFTTGAPIAFVYYGYPLLLSGVAAALVVLTFLIVCLLTKNPRLSSLVAVAAILVAILGFVTATSDEIFDRLWWRAFNFYAALILIPAIIAAASTWTAVARRPPSDRGARISGRHHSRGATR